MKSFTGESYSAQTSQNSRQTGNPGKRGFSNWPFTPLTSSSSLSSSGAVSSSGTGYSTGAAKAKGQLTRAGMVTDVCLVVVWGATIPGLMWLGALSGF